MSVQENKNFTQAHVEALQEIAVQLINSSDDHELLTFIVKRAMSLLSCDGGSLYLRRDDENLVFAVAANQSIVYEFERKLIPIEGNGIAAYVYRTGTSLKIDDVYKLGSKCPYHFETLFDVKLGYRTRTVLAIPLLSSKGDKLGVLQLINRKESETVLWQSDNLERLESMPSFSNADQELLRAFAALASASIEKAKLYEDIEKLFEGFIRASVRVIEERDPGTRGHSERVATLTVDLARKVTESEEHGLANLRYSHKQLQELHYAALLHDFGKVSISERILLKEEKLFTEELLRIRSRLDHFGYSAENRILWEALRQFARTRRVPTDLDLATIGISIRDQKSQIEGYWDVIRESNRPTVLDANGSKKLHEMKDKVLPVSDGELRRVLEPNEFLSLSIRKGSLTENERREVEQHVTSTYLFLKEIPWTAEYAQVPEVAYCHHEKLDATGYPRKLQAQEIPLQSRMMAICDIYDALVASDRPYKKSLPIEKALAILEDEAKAGKLDPRFLKVFIEAKIYVNTEFLSLNPFKNAA